MSLIKRATILSLLLYCSHLQALDGCPDFLVKFWYNFSQYHGIDTVPAFLIKNNCIAGPSILVENYEKQERLLNQDHIAQDYFLGYVDTSNEALLSLVPSERVESDSKQETIGIQTPVKDSHFEEWIQLFKQPDSDNIIETKSEISAPTTKPSSTIVQFIIIKVQNNKVNYFLAFALILILSMVAFKYYKKFNICIWNNNRANIPSIQARTFISFWRIVSTFELKFMN